MVRRKRDWHTHTSLPLRLGRKRHHSRLSTRNPTPIDLKEHTLLGSLRRDIPSCRRQLHPRRIGFRRPGEWRRASGRDVDESVAEGDEGVDGEGRVPAVVALAALVLVVAGPGAGDAFGGDAHCACEGLFFGLDAGDERHAG